MKYSDELLGSAGVEDTTYKIDKYFRRIETIEMSLSERGRMCAHQYQHGTNYFILFVELSSEDLGSRIAGAQESFTPRPGNCQADKLDVDHFNSHL